jgi:putative sterol carrier protein
VYEFRVDDEVFHTRVEDGTIESVYGPAQRPDVVIETTAEVFVELAAGRVTLAEAVRGGATSVSGDQRVARKLRSLFRRPRPQARTAEETAAQRPLPPVSPASARR